jgi:hypothetical protein
MRRNSMMITMILCALLFGPQAMQAQCKKSFALFNLIYIYEGAIWIWWWASFCMCPPTVSTWGRLLLLLLYNDLGFLKILQAVMNWWIPKVLSSTPHHQMRERLSSTFASASCAFTSDRSRRPTATAVRMIRRKRVATRQCKSAGPTAWHATPNAHQRHLLNL